MARLVCRFGAFWALGAAIENEGEDYRGIRGSLRNICCQMTSSIRSCKKKVIGPMYGITVGFDPSIGEPGKTLNEKPTSRQFCVSVSAKS